MSQSGREPPIPCTAGEYSSKELISQMLICLFGTSTSLNLTWAPEGESGRLPAATTIPHHEVNLLKTNDQFLLNPLKRWSHGIPMWRM